MRIYLKGLTAILLLMSQTVTAQNQLTASEMKTMTTESAGSVVSIHDPSVVHRDGKFYIWGSHLGVASSQDLITYKGLSATNQTFAKPNGTRCGFATAFNEQAVEQAKNYKGEMVDFPQVDAEAWCSWYAENKETWVNGNMWAPDIVWNETMQKWCMYLSLNGDRWASVIILLTAPSATGPFTYQGPVVMGGFNGESGAPSYKDTDMAMAMGNVSSLPARYNQRGSWGTYWPNCIDPCAFFDEEGELWLAYGSWSGGIFMLRLDKETGLRDYTYTYTSDFDSQGANFTSDPYFGKKIAGGHYVSGEGPYIQHIGQYYYLFMSYGGFAPGGFNADGGREGGYEMRVFRSQNPDGPYTDATGKSALFRDRWVLNFGYGATDNRGTRLMAAYNHWGNQNVGERSQGHNSACQDDEGRTFVVYHTKFNDGTIGHQVRTHQLFLNEKDWLVCAPFCYRGETLTDEDLKTGCPFTADEIAGDYHFMLLPYGQDQGNYEEVIPTTLTLTADGKVRGAQSGTWSLKQGTGYLTLKLGSTTYNGVFMLQHVNGATTQNYKTTPMEALAFSAMAANGVPVWGYKLMPKYAIARNYVDNSIPVREGGTYNQNLSLMYTPVENTTLTWTSSEPDVISETGKYNPREEVTPVTLTGRLECGNWYWEQSYNVKAQQRIIPDGDYLGGLLAYYDMNQNPCYNAYDVTERTVLGSTGTKSVLTDDYDRFGKVLHQWQGDKGKNSFTRMPNPLLDKTDLEGFSVSLWVKRTDENTEDALWGFFNGTTATANGARLFLTGNSYLRFDDNADTWFDINSPESGTYNDIPVGKWTVVTLTMGPTNGVRLYINGTSRSLHKITTNAGTVTARNLPVDAVVEQLTKMRYFYLGMGGTAGSADCYFDDVMIYNRELSATDVRALNTMLNRVSDFTIGEGGTDIGEIKNEGLRMKDEVYDLSGRRVERPIRGLYIREGKKILVK